MLLVRVCDLSGAKSEVVGGGEVGEHNLSTLLVNVVAPRPE